MAKNNLNLAVILIIAIVVVFVIVGFGKAPITGAGVSHTVSVTTSVTEQVEIDKTPTTINFGSVAQGGSAAATETVSNVGSVKYVTVKYSQNGTAPYLFSTTDWAAKSLTVQLNTASSASPGITSAWELGNELSIPNSSSPKTIIKCLSNTPGQNWATVIDRVHVPLLEPTGSKSTTLLVKAYSATSYCPPSPSQIDIWVDDPAVDAEVFTGSFDQSTPYTFSSGVDVVFKNAGDQGIGAGEYNGTFKVLDSSGDTVFSQNESIPALGVGESTTITFASGLSLNPGQWYRMVAGISPVDNVDVNNEGIRVVYVRAGTGTQ